MKISVVGIGYVGLPTAIIFAANGHTVTCVDIDKRKVDIINSGRSHFYERDLEKSLKNVLKAKKLKATTEIKDAINNNDITFICVGTPSRNDGSIDVQYVVKACSDIGEILKNKDSYHVIVVKSTVVPGTTEGMIKSELERKSGKSCGKDFGLCMNPEFLREGSAMHDAMNPDRIVIGQYDKRSGDILFELYKKFDAETIRTNIKTAEMIKYASNSLFATLISFSNEISDICEAVGGIDSRMLFEGIHLDRRITEKGKKAGIAHYIKSGCGYGGSCFPKDVNAIVNYAEKIGNNPRLLREVRQINDERVEKIIKRVEKIIRLNGKTVSVLGIAFKADTDDIRESQGIKLVERLIDRGALVKIYDPMALGSIGERKNLRKAGKIEEALKNSELCFIMTDWEEFKSIKESQFKNLMKTPIVFDAKKILPPMNEIKYMTVGE